MPRSLVCLVVCLLLSAQAAFAQPLAAYVDVQNQVMVWDRGMVRKIDYLAPSQMKVGRIAIPYIDNSGSFKIYYNGAVKKLNDGFTNAFFVTDDLIPYLNQKSLNVFDQGVTKNIAAICDQYMIGDSVVLFLDAVKSEYDVYYNGQVHTVEAFIPDSVLPSVKVSDNIVAYDNFASQFRIFYHGKIINQEDYPVTSFDAGRNTVAYVDANKQFKIFHSGQTYIIDDYAPISYSAGDNLVAFVSQDGYFKIFYADSIHTVGFFNPTYKVGDNIVAYKDPSGFFQVFYKGAVTEMENYYPTSFKVQYNSVAYVNTSGTLRLFSDGEVYDVTNADVDGWQLSYDVIKYQIGENIFKIFYKGTEY